MGGPVVPTTIPAADIIAWWPGEDGTPEGLEDIINAQDASSATGMTKATGYVGNHYLFDATANGGDGVSAVISTSTFFDRIFTSKELTIEGWIDFDSLPSVVTGQHFGIMSRGTWNYGDGTLAIGTESQFTLYVGDTGTSRRLYFYLNRGGSTYGINFVMSASSGVHHVAAVLQYNGSQHRVILYFDLVAEASTSYVPEALVSSSGGILIGNMEHTDTSFAGFTGALDEMTIYDKALTPAQIAAIVAQGSAGKTGIVTF